VDRQALDRAAAAYGIQAVFDDPRSLLEAARPQLLGVATRTLGRAALIRDAVQRGVAALHVEKPLCNGMQELALLEAALADPNLYVTYGALRRHLAPYRRAREWARSGRYGALREIRVALGAGALFWSHPHSIDLLLFGAGDRQATGVQARLADVDAPGGGMEVRNDPRVVLAAVHFDDGVVGHITQAVGSDFVLSCSDAEIVVRADGGLTQVYATRDGAIYPSLESIDAPDAHPGPGGTLAPLSQLVGCLDGDPQARRDNATVKRDMLAGQRIAFAMLQSHREGSRIVDPSALDGDIFIHARTGDRHA
jgi:predicted dehydrogenase